MECYGLHLPLLKKKKKTKTEIPYNNKPLLQTEIYIMIFQKTLSTITNNNNKNVYKIE